MKRGMIFLLVLIIVIMFNSKNVMGVSKEIPLGVGIANTSTGFDIDLKQDDISTLRVDTITFQSLPYNTHEALILGRSSPSIATAITEAQKDVHFVFLFDRHFDEDFVFVNQMIKYFKFGFGKVTDEVCELIRYGRMTREEGFELVKKYDGLCSPEYIRRFCDYLEISEKEFWRVAESYRNKNLFEKTTDGWRLKDIDYA